jgi:riboflavin kinase/FMN adenylyltransferase
MRVVAGVDQLPAAVGRVFVVIGVFDGLHLGHAYLLRHLVAEAAQRDAAPMVITFDHHPDEVLTGHAPPLLVDPDERLERLAAAGVEVIVVQHFDDDLRRTTYDDFVGRIRARVPLAGFLMTPDAAFGFERRGTPDTLRVLGATEGFDVVVVPPFDLDGRAVRSTEIRELIAAGRLDEAASLLGRPFTLAGDAVDGLLTTTLPMAMPPDGPYQARVDGQVAAVEIREGRCAFVDGSPDRRIVVELLPR